MGLYDNYKLSNSQTIPVFQGGLSTELSKTQAGMNTQYEAAQENMGIIGDLLTQVPIRDQDKETLASLAQETNAKLDEFSGREDLENLQGATSRLGRNVKNKVAVLTQQKQAEDTYVKSIQDLGLSQRDTQLAIQMAKENSTPVKFGTDGRPIGGFTGGPKLMKDIDVLDKIRKHLSILNPNITEIKQDAETGDYQVKENNTWKGIDPQQLQLTLNSAMQADPELKAYLEQRTMLDTYSATQGKSEEAILAYVNSDQADPQFKTMIQERMAKGESAKQALTAIEASRAQNQTYQNILQYARGKLNTEHTTDIFKGLSELGKAKLKDQFEQEKEKRENAENDRRALRDAALKEQEESSIGVITSPSTGLDISDATTYKELDGKISDADKNLSALKTRLGQFYNFNADGTVGSAKGNIPNNITGLVQSQVEQYNELNSQAGDYKALKSHALNQAASKYSTKGPDGKPVTFNSYDEAEKYFKEYERKAIPDMLRKYAPDKMGVGGTHTKEAIAKMVEEGGKLDYGYGLAGRRTSIIGVTDKDGKYHKLENYQTASLLKDGVMHKIENVESSKFLNQIKNDAETNFNSYRKNASVHTTEFTLDTKGKENSAAAALDDAVARHVGGNYGSMKIFPYGKTSKDELDIEEEGIDLSKAKVNTYSAMKGGSVKVNMTVPTKDGKGTRVVSTIFPSGSDLAQRLTQIAGGNSDPYTAASVQSVNKNSLANRIAFNPKQGVPTPVGNKLANGKDAVRIHTEASSGTNRYFIEIWDKEAGKYVKLPAKDGISEYSSNDPVEAAHIAERVYNEYSK